MAEDWIKPVRISLGVANIIFIVSLLLTLCSNFIDDRSALILCPRLFVSIQLEVSQFEVISKIFWFTVHNFLV